uniref:Uncharacterized protein n=1 Tax=Brassica oleracea var. oleracea TaxID=109376 RepID=A0A0D3DZX3_BRAOL
MGGCFSFGFSCDETLERLFRWLTCEGYVRNIEENLTDLKRQMEDLKATEDEVKNRVEREEGLLHQQRRPAVKVKNLKLEGGFKEVTEPRSVVEARPTRPTVGQEQMFEKAWNRLTEWAV